MAKTPKTFTHSLPLAERTTVMFDTEGFFANSVDDKMELLTDRKLPLFAAWPGTYETHVFKLVSQADRRAAMKMLAGLRG